MSKQTGLPGRETSWNKRTDIPLTPMKRPSSNPSPRKHPNYNQSDRLHKLNRTEQVILFRLRTGHNRLNAHVYNKFKVGESEMCPCNADIMTAEHLLQHCPLHDAMRLDTWPEPTLLRDKLYCNLEELRRTAAFVRATGISIWRTTKKKVNQSLPWPYHATCLAGYPLAYRYVSQWYDSVE